MTRHSQSPQVRSHDREGDFLLKIFFTVLYDMSFVFFPGELLEKISVIKPTHLLEGASRYPGFVLLT